MHSMLLPTGSETMYTTISFAQDELNESARSAAATVLTSKLDLTFSIRTSMCGYS